MTEQPNLDLGLLAQQQRQALAEIGTMRADIAKMTAVLQGLDGTMAGLVSEVHATDPASSGCG